MTTHTEEGKETLSMGPKPRYRIYSSRHGYLSAFLDLLCFRSGRGTHVDRFEEEVRNRIGSPHSICVPQARVGIYLALRELIQPGQKVVVSPYTISDVINMVVCAGGVPVFADIEPETWNINPEDAQSLLDKDTGAVLVTHLHGLAADVEGLAEECKKRGIAFLEDSAQAFGCLLNGKQVGTLGDAGIFSFGMYKNLNTFFGGMVVTPHQDLHQKIERHMAEFPHQELMPTIKKMAQEVVTDIVTWPPVFRNFVFPIFRYGYIHKVDSLNKHVKFDMDPDLKREIPPNYLRRLRPMQARVGLLGLPQVDADRDTRVGYARMYFDGLKDIQELLLPPFREDGSHMYTYFPIQYPEPEKLIRFMMEKGRDVAQQNLKNCADLPCFKEFYRDCPVARKTAVETVLLPTYPRYGSKEVERNIQVIQDFFRRGARKK